MFRVLGMYNFGTCMSPTFELGPFEFLEANDCTNVQYGSIGC